MHSDDSADRLRELLEEAGVDLERPTAADVERTWSVWPRFAREPAEDVTAVLGDEDDGVLAQYGVYDWTYSGNERYELDMTRQFSFYEDGEYDHMAQLHCTFKFDPIPELRAVGASNLWSFGLGLDAFFERALALPGFTVVRGLLPVELDIGYSDV